jgi:predicted acetyltransferase
MTTWTPRPIDTEEIPAVVDLLSQGFGAGPTAPPDLRAAMLAAFERDRTVVVEDGDRLVATGTNMTFTLTLPRGGTVPMAGVSGVVVAPTHRRRGLLTAILDCLHEQALARGEVIAGLTASEGGIYRRFGYGVATRFQTVAVDAARSAEVASHDAARDAAAGDDADRRRFRLLSEAEAEPVLPAVWDRHRRRVPGEVDRTPGWWAEHALDPESGRDGASARYIAVHHDATGEPDGFVIYRIAQGFGMDGTRHEARIADLAAADDAVEAALLRFVLDTDLVGRGTIRAPVDLPLRWRLGDPRAITVTGERDLLWLRPLDVAACLAGRGYATAGELTVEVVDDRRPVAGGIFRVEADADGTAACGRVEAAGAGGDLSIGVADLGAVLAGGTTWSVLHRSGLVDELRAGAVDRADALFRPYRAAYCGTDF